MKKTYLLSAILFSLSSCNHINKIGLKKESVHRGIASINPNYQLQNNKKPNKKASHVVLFRNNNPLCIASAVDHPKLVPPRLNTTQTNHSINLPKCNVRTVVEFENKIQQAVLITDKRDGIQVAGAPIVVAGICLANAALSYYLSKNEALIDTSINTNFGFVLFGSFALLGDVQKGVVINTNTSRSTAKHRQILKKGSNLNKLFKQAGIVGLCGIGGNLTAFIINSRR